jgi:CHAT domain-containing protein/tetratricopeptide (TPR) repeat protein
MARYVICSVVILLSFWLQAVGWVGAEQATPRPAEARVEAARTAQMGEDLYTSGQYSDALDYYDRALALFRAAGDRRSEADVISDQAIVYRKLGDFQRSLALQRQALAMYETLGDTDGQAKALRRIGVLYRHQGELFQAITFQERALEFMRTADDQQGIAAILTNLGTIYGDLGRLRDARSYFERALQIYTALDNRAGVAYTLGNLGQLYLYLGDSQQALQYLERSLTIKQSLEDTRGQANTFLNIGTAYENLGDFEKALTYFYKALNMYKQLNDRHGQAATLGSIGSTYESLGDLESALQFQLQSLELKKLSGTPLRLTIGLTNLASLAIKQGRFAEADAYLQEGLTIATTHKSSLAQANIYGQLGVLHLQQQKPETALDNFVYALELYEEIGSQKGLLEVFDYIGRAYLAKAAFRQARPYYERALDLAERLNDMNTLWTVQYRLGQIALHRHEQPQALTYFKSSIDILERMRNYLNVPELRQLFMRQNLNPYTQVIRLLLQRQQVEEALLYLERFKARTFLELVAHGEPQLQTVPDLLQEEQYLAARIRYLNERVAAAFDDPNAAARTPDAEEEGATSSLKDLKQELHDAKEAYEQLLLRMKLEYPDYYRLKIVDAEEIQQLISQAFSLLDDNVVILEYFLDEATVHVWIIEQNRIHHKAVPIAHKAILDRVFDFRAELRDYTSEAVYAPLQDLYTWLIEPVEAYLADKTVVGIVPFQILHFVPFSAFIDPDAEPAALPAAKPIPAYLIEDYAVFSLPSLSMLPIVREQRRQNLAHAQAHQRLLGIGNATDDLPGAAAEIQTITSYLPDSTGYTGPEATKQRVFEEAGEYEIVHLATHGVYDKQHPMFSYLEFSQESYLYAREIFGLQLWANLVTLSGCETLLPQKVEADDLHTLVSGDELVGFVRAFMFAGTPSVLSSLWKVSDTATQYLMSAFYQNLLQMGKVRSLQHACRTVMRSTIRMGRRKSREIRLTHPFFWSSFVLIGDWK